LEVAKQYSNPHKVNAMTTDDLDDESSQDDMDDQADIYNGEPYYQQAGGYAIRTELEDTNEDPKGRSTQL
jgi:hypothetical protein